MSNSLFVLTGNQNLRTSPDGITWTARTSTTNPTFNAVTYGAGKWVAAASDGIHVSTDVGVTWSRVATSPTDGHSIAFGNGLFVLGTNGGTVYTSTDGTIWTAGSNRGQVTEPGQVQYADGVWLIATSSGAIALSRSTDGTTWSTVSGVPFGITSLAYNGSRWVLVSKNQWNVIYYSNDGGLTWTATTGTSGFATLHDVAFGNGTFVAVGRTSTGTDAVLRSADGATWTATSPLTNPDGVITFAAGVFVWLVNSATGGTSPNGTTWTSRSGVGSITDVHGADLNAPPNAPTLTAPADGAPIDRTAVNRFGWAFSDPDAGDSQSKFSLYYRLVGAPSWTTVTQTTPNSFYDMPAGTLASGDYEWQAETYDAQGVLGARSGSSFFTAATAPPAPTITAPINGATFAQSEAVTWSAPDQDAYQLRILDAADAVVSDTGEVTSTTDRSRTVDFPVNNVVRKIQVRVKDNGLWSPYYTISGNVSWTPPPAPVVTLTPDAATGGITVGITNPAPGAEEPTVAYNEVWVDDGDGLERRATSLPTNTPWTYWTPRSGRDYDGAVMVRAVATNGTTADSI